MKNINTCVTFIIGICAIFLVQIQSQRQDWTVVESASSFLGTTYLPMVKQNQVADSSLSILAIDSPPEISKFELFEINFQLEGVTDQNRQLPYLAAAESNEFTQSFVDEGVSVDGIFVDPNGNEYRQPAFWFEEYAANLAPTGEGSWQVRFSPHLPGEWRYRLVAISRDGSAMSTAVPFTVTDSAERGFVRVAEQDVRYFELDNGDYFSNIGFNYSIKDLDDAELIANLSENGINYVRTWVTRLNITGGAWSRLSTKPTVYDGYLPRDGIIPYTPLGKSEPEFWWRVAQQHDWYSRCLYTNQEYDPIAVKPHTDYLVQTEFESYGVTPADSSQPYGFTIMIDGWVDDCNQLESSAVITPHPDKQNEQNVTAQGIWNSGERSIIPYVYLALDNASAGDAYIKSVSIREKLADGGLGPELFVEPVPDTRTIYSQRESAILDQIVTQAEDHDLFLRLVISEKEDPLFLRSDPYGRPTRSDRANFYGDGRTVQYNRFVQMAWWRYVQARWGYSTAVHSWELINEGDPFNGNHYALADEFGKYMNCTVFGVEIESLSCDYDHPNGHLVSTSFWHSFPSEPFWGNSTYPNIDFADIHRYLPATEADTHQDLARAVFNLANFAGHGAAESVQKPVIRGETGLVESGTSGAVAVLRDGDNPVWLHNMLWSSLNERAVIEAGYWYVKEHIANEDFSLLNHYAEFANFANQLPLNNGQYRALKGAFTQEHILVGQIDEVSQQAHGWLRHPDFNWPAVEAGQSEFQLDGTLTINGFKAGQDYAVKLKAFGLKSGYSESGQILSASADGSLKIESSTALDIGSVAFMIAPIEMIEPEETLVDDDLPARDEQTEVDPRQRLRSEGIGCTCDE